MRHELNKAPEALELWKHHSPGAFFICKKYFEKICNFYEKSVDRISHKEYYGEGGRNKPHKRREEDNKWQI